MHQLQFAQPHIGCLHIASCKVNQTLPAQGRSIGGFNQQNFVERLCCKVESKTFVPIHAFFTERANIGLLCIHIGKCLQWQYQGYCHKAGLNRQRKCAGPQARIVFALSHSF